MQTLGLAESTPRSESRIKALLWPSIQNATDVDYLSTQGLWVCAFVAILSLLGGFLTGHPIAGISVCVLYVLSGVGVRQGSIVAALMALLCYVADSFASGVGVMRIIFAAILVSNMRATWLASKWKPESAEAEMPPRLNDTLGDKFTDQSMAMAKDQNCLLHLFFLNAYLDYGGDYHHLSARPQGARELDSGSHQA